MYVFVSSKRPLNCIEFLIKTVIMKAHKSHKIKNLVCNVGQGPKEIPYFDKNPRHEYSLE